MNIINQPSKFTIQSLRAAGFKVKVVPFRRFKYMKDGKVIEGFFNNFDALTFFGPSLRHCLQHNGGFYSVDVTTPGGESVYGYSQCNEEDKFVKRIGRELALLNALNKLSKSVEEILG